MIKKNKGGKIILVTGLLAIAIVTICAFEKDNITRKYYEYTIDKKYSSTDVNDYYLEDNFNYVNNYTGTGIKNNEELVGFIYFALNSGNTYVERYCNKYELKSKGFKNWILTTDKCTSKNQYTSIRVKQTLSKMWKLYALTDAALNEVVEETPTVMIEV